MAGRAERWEKAKRRWIPLAFLVVLGLLGFRTCESEASDVTVVVDLGARAADARSLSVEYVRDGEDAPVATMRLTYGPGGAPGPAKQSLKLTPGGYTARIEIATDAGIERIVRKLRVDGSATIRVSP
jgi:hypothetical protein